MNFNINFTFLDEKNFEVELSEKNLKRFLTSISKNEVFWDDKGGFWLSFNNLRYFKIIPIEQEPPIIE